MKTTTLEDQITKLISIQLPGGVNQFKHLLDQEIHHGDRALIIGPQCESIAKALLSYFTNVYVITDDYDSLMQNKMKLGNGDKVKIKMMDYAHTDFDDNYFKLIYAQGSVSIPERKNILKEMKKILAKDGLISIGEIVSLKEPVAGFVKDIWERSGLGPIASSAIKKFYESKGFNVISEQDYSDTLKDFYEEIRLTVSKAGKDEKEQDKKYFSRLKHESNAYLKLGGDKYIGFKSLIMRKSN
jgi:ubiquinone/menaquinone biosynthesis C-methylase UbiE